MRRARSMRSGSPWPGIKIATSAVPSAAKPARSCSPPLFRRKGAVPNNKVRGPMESERRRTSTRRHSALPPGDAGENVAGNPGSCPGSWGKSSQPNRTARTGSSAARSTRPGSRSRLRAAVGLGATTAWAAAAPNEARNRLWETAPDSSPALPRSSMSSPDNSPPTRPLGTTNTRTAAAEVESAGAAVSPQPIATSAFRIPSWLRARAVSANSKADSPRVRPVAPAMMSWACPCGARPSYKATS